MPRPVNQISKRLWLATLLSLAASGVLAGCAGTLNVPAQRPADFALVLTVYPVENEPTVNRRAEGTPGARPARYAIEPDGRLRAELGTGVVAPSYPPIARRLEPSQVDALYAHVVALELGGDAANTSPSAVPVPGPQVYAPSAGRPIALIEVASLGISRAFEINTADPRSTPLIRELERLTWQDR